MFNLTDLYYHVSHILATCASCDLHFIRFFLRVTKYMCAFWVEPENMPKYYHPGCFSACSSVSFLKEKLGEHCYSSVSHEMCFVSYTLCSACGHVSGCRSGLFAEAMFLDMVKWNTRLNSISMLKSWVWCHWKGQNSKGCGLARFYSLVGLKFLIDWWLKCYDYCFMLSQYCILAFNN